MCVSDGHAPRPLLLTGWLHSHSNALARPLGRALTLYAALAQSLTTG
jgi:hypothetical protein